MAAEDPRVVVQDGAPLPERAARALSERLDVYLDERGGDVAGFARREDLHEVRIEYRDGREVLVVWTRPPSPEDRERARRASPAPAGGAEPRRAA